MIWWQQLQTFMWLRWRIRSNRIKRAAPGSLIVERVISALAALSAVITLTAGFSVGLLLLARVPAAVVMLVWDGIAAGFLFFWMLELVNELQRSEMLSLEKFLHLPVSLSGVFLMNYLSSLFCLSVTLFLPLMIGLSAGLVLSRGPIMLLLFPVVGAFFFMVTGLTYQFRGWLASLMQNKRRRRTIITILTISMVLLFQLPNLLTFRGGSGGARNRQTLRAVQEETSKLDRMLAAHEIDRPEYDRQSDLILKKYGVTKARPDAMRLQDAESTARTANLIIPAGWLPYGVLTLLEGRILPSMLAFMGLSLIGLASLTRSYRTTLRLYTGQFTSRKRRPAQDKIRAENVVRKPAVFLEKHLPLVSEQASAITLACFRSLLRAPEAKMMLLTPVIFTLVFGSTFLRVHSNPAELLRPVMAAALMGMILLGMTQLAGNQFGFDRSGFRVFVLAGASRKDILLGKNLALLPFAIGFGIIGIAVLQFAYPMQIDHLLAASVQMISMYLVFCVVLNFLSMLAPAAIGLGSLRPVRPKGMMILIHLLFFFIVLPPALGLTLIPLAIEYLLPRFPAYFLLTLAEFAVIAYLYPRVLGLQGRLLRKREQRILEIVTAKAE